MAKVYYCKNLIKDGEYSFKICGEDNHENFFEKRYSQCKKCRTNAVKESIKKRKEKSMREIIDEQISDIKEGHKIFGLIEKTIIGRAFTDDGLTIPESLHFTKGDLKNTDIKLSNFILETEEENKKLQTENNYLKKEISKLKEDISKIKGFLEEKYNFYILNP